MGTANEIRLYPEQFDDLFSGATEWFILYTDNIKIEEGSILVIRNRYDNDEAIKGDVVTVHKYNTFTEIRLANIEVIEEE
jgi:hypothetical protein